MAFERIRAWVRREPEPPLEDPPRPPFEFTDQDWRWVVKVMRYANEINLRELEDAWSKLDAIAELVGEPKNAYGSYDHDKLVAAVYNYGLGEPTEEAQADE